MSRKPYFQTRLTQNGETQPVRGEYFVTSSGLLCSVVQCSTLVDGDMNYEQIEEDSYRDDMVAQS